MAFDRRTAESGRAAQQLRGVLDAVAAVASDLSLDGLLERILRQAGGLVGAEAGFLHVLDPRSDRRIGSFAAYGIPGVDDLKHPGAQFVDDLVDRTDGTAVIEVPIRIHDVEFGRMYLIGESAGSGMPPPHTRGTRVAVQTTRGFHDPARACHARCFIRPVGFVIVTQVNRGERFTMVLFGL